MIYIFLYIFPYCNSFGTFQGHYSPLTRGKAKSSLVSTPESLKLRRTRSGTIYFAAGLCCLNYLLTATKSTAICVAGRVVVPTLDPGCQRIVYDRVSQET